MNNASSRQEAMAGQQSILRCRPAGPVVPPAQRTPVKYYHRSYVLEVALCGVRARHQLTPEIVRRSPTGSDADDPRLSPAWFIWWFDGVLESSPAWSFLRWCDGVLAIDSYLPSWRSYMDWTPSHPDIKLGVRRNLSTYHLVRLSNSESGVWNGAYGRNQWHGRFQ